MHAHTLFDFLTHTKAVAYSAAGVFLVCFVLFWSFLTERESEKP